MLRGDHCIGRSSLGSVFAVNAVERGLLNFGVVQSDRNWQAYNGSADWDGKPVKGLRSVLSVHPETVMLVTRTGIQGFIYDMRTAILPFVFIFNLELLMIAGVGEGGEIIWLEDVLKIGWVVLAAVVAMFAFAAGVQGQFADRCGWGERALLLLVCVTAFRPALVTDLTGGARETVQAAAAAVFVGLYLLQRRRRAARAQRRERVAIG